MRHQWHDDEVYLQRERHSISLGHSQRHMQIALFMASIIRKAFRHGFHRPTTKDDVMETVTECRDCQFFSEVNYEVYKSSSTYRSLLAFHNLGNQYCGCFTQGTSWIQIFIRRHRYVTKWLEAMRVVNIM
jgi:hypothetical protein